MKIKFTENGQERTGTTITSSLIKSDKYLIIPDGGGSYIIKNKEETTLNE